MHDDEDRPGIVLPDLGPLTQSHEDYAPPRGLTPRERMIVSAAIRSGLALPPEVARWARKIVQ